MIAWLIWAVRLSASSFMLLVSGLLVLFFFTTNDKALMAGLAAMFGLAGFFSFPRRPNAWKQDPPTQKQIDYASKLGIVVMPGMTKGELSALISQVTGR